MVSFVPLLGLLLIRVRLLGFFVSRRRIIIFEKELFSPLKRFWIAEARQWETGRVVNHVLDDRFQTNTSIHVDSLRSKFFGERKNTRKTLRQQTFDTIRRKLCLISFINQCEIIVQKGHLPNSETPAKVRHNSMWKYVDTTFLLLPFVPWPAVKILAS